MFDFHSRRKTRGFLIDIAVFLLPRCPRVRPTFFRQNPARFRPDAPAVLLFDAYATSKTSTVRLAHGVTAGKSPPRSSKSPRRRQVITRSSRESPRSSAMFPYMVSGDKNVDPEERSKADQESDSKTCRASADEKHIVDDKTLSVLNGKIVTETAVSGTVKGVSSAKAARDSRQSPTMSKAKIVTSTQTEECKERITEVHVKEVETFSSVKTHEQTREEIVTVEWKPQGLGRSKPCK